MEPITFFGSASAAPTERSLLIEKMARMAERIRLLEGRSHAEIISAIRAAERAETQSPLHKGWDRPFQAVGLVSLWAR